jgi:ArsR family transcriptional regulator
MKEDYSKQNNAIKLFKILSNANRLKIIKFLIEQNGNSSIVKDIAAATSISENNLSNHLKLMRISKILSAKQNGSFMSYSIKEPMIIDIVKYALK